MTYCGPSGHEMVKQQTPSWCFPEYDIQHIIVCSKTKIKFSSSYQYESYFFRKKTDLTSSKCPYYPK